MPNEHSDNWGKTKTIELTSLKCLKILVRVVSQALSVGHIVYIVR